MEKSFRMLLLCGLLCIVIAGCKHKTGTLFDKSNPFYSDYETPFGVPPFNIINARHYMPAFEKGMQEGRADLEKIIEN